MPSPTSVAFGASRLSEGAILRKARAKLYPTPDGGYRLSTIQQFSRPFFRPSGWEAEEPKRGAPCPPDLDPDGDEAEAGEGDEPRTVAERSLRRARIRLFDLAESNPQLDAFVTLTYSPEAVGDKSDYAECYGKLRPFLSNRVQRHALQYVGVPELTKKGDVHFHLLANSCAMQLTPATFPDTGKLIKHHCSPVYNVEGWDFGFSTAQLLTDREGAGDAARKYLMKYITKGAEKIGGRLFLHGGALAEPLYLYGDDISDFADLIPASGATYEKAAEIVDGVPTPGNGEPVPGAMTYRLWSFL